MQRSTSSIDSVAARLSLRASAVAVEFVAPLDRTPANAYPDALATEADPELTPEQLKFIQDHGSGVLTEKFYSWLVEVSAKTLRNAMAVA